MESTKIVVFKGKNIRKTIFKNEWWFAITDVIAVLSGRCPLTVLLPNGNYRPAFILIILNCYLF